MRSTCPSARLLRWISAIAPVDELSDGVAALLRRASPGTSLEILAHPVHREAVVELSSIIVLLGSSISASRAEPRTDHLQTSLMLSPCSPKTTPLARPSTRPPTTPGFTHPSASGRCPKATRHGLRESHGHRLGVAERARVAAAHDRQTPTRPPRAASSLETGVSMNERRQPHPARELTRRLGGSGASSKDTASDDMPANAPSASVTYCVYVRRSQRGGRRYARRAASTASPRWRCRTLLRQRSALAAVRS